MKIVNRRDDRRVVYVFDAKKLFTLCENRLLFTLLSLRVRKFVWMFFFMGQRS